MIAGSRAATASRHPFELFDRHPRSAAVAAALGIATAGITFVLSGASPSTAVFFPSAAQALAVPVALGRVGDRHGPRAGRRRKTRIAPAGTGRRVTITMSNQSIPPPATCAAL